MIGHEARNFGHCTPVSAFHLLGDDHWLGFTERRYGFQMGPADALARKINNGRLCAPQPKATVISLATNKIGVAEDLKAHFWELINPRCLTAKRGARCFVQSCGVKRECNGRVDFSRETVPKVDRVIDLTRLYAYIVHRRRAKATVINLESGRAVEVFASIIRLCTST